MTLKDHITTFTKKTSEDVNSNRVRITYAMTALFIYVVLYSLKHYPEAITTLITVTGSVVTVVFTGYLFSKNAEKKRDALLNPTNGGGENDGG